MLEDVSCYITSKCAQRVLRFPRMLLHRDAQRLQTNSTDLLLFDVV